MNTLRLPISRLLTAAAIAAAMLLPAIPLAAQAQVYLSFNVGAAPPLLPEYTQPMLTEPGQTWQPGYWAWGAQGYYWVPGTWVTPPSANVYWTPGYWGYDNGSYAWNNGYWAPQVGYYGGINYGYGYSGTGYTGGYWNNGAFAYNTAVNSVDTRVIRTTYVRRIVEPRVVTRYAFNGPGGVRVRPTLGQLAVLRERRIAPTNLQVEHARVAAQDRNLYARYNGGHPRVVAVQRPVRSVQSLPHFDRVTAHAATVQRDHTAKADRTRAAVERQHAAVARAHAATVHTQAATAHAHNATLRARTSTRQAHNATVRAHESAPARKPPASDTHKRPPLR